MYVNVYLMSVYHITITFFNQINNQVMYFRAQKNHPLNFGKCDRVAFYIILSYHWSARTQSGEACTVKISRFLRFFQFCKYSLQDNKEAEQNCCNNICPGTDQLAMSLNQ